MVVHWFDMLLEMEVREVEGNPEVNRAYSAQSPQMQMNLKCAALLTLTHCMLQVFPRCI
jgi:hypothetical protein